MSTIVIGMDSGLEQELKNIFYYSDSIRTFPLRQEGIYFRISYFRLFISVLITSIFCYGVFYVVLNGYYFPVYGLVLVCYNVQTVIMAVIFPMYVIWSVVRVRKLNEVIRGIEDWDHRLSTFGLRPDYVVPTRWLKFHFVLFFLAFTSDFVCYIYGFIWSLNELVIYFASFLCKMFVVHESASLIRICLKRFRLISDSLTNGQFKNQGSKIVKLISNYQYLCSILEEVNTLVSPFILVITSDFFSNVTFGLYYIEYFSETDHMELVYSMVYDCVAWATIYLIYTCDLLSASTNAINEANKFNISLYKLMLKDRKKGLLKNRMLHLHILMKKKVTFIIHGSFNLDYTLFLAIIRAVITYIFILIQFGMMKSSSSTFSNNSEPHFINSTFINPNS